MERIDENALKYPVLVFTRRSVRVRNSADALTSSTVAGVKNGMFSDADLIDSRGHMWRIAQVTKLGGRGFLWGWNVFLNQAIRVALETESGPRTVSLSAVKERAIAGLSRWSGFESRGDYQSLETDLRAASSIEEVARILGE